MKRVVTMTVMAAALVISSNAKGHDDVDYDDFADDEQYYMTSNGEVDWTILREWSELVDTYENEKGELRNVFLDLFQEVMWEEPAETDAAMETDAIIVFYLVPSYLRYWVEGDPDYHLLGGGALEYVGSCGINCRLWRNSVGLCPRNVAKIRARATSVADYCDSNYIPQYYPMTFPYSWEDTESDSCGGVTNDWWYTLQEDTGLNHRNYYSSDLEWSWMVRLKYKINGISHWMQINCIDVPE